MDACELIAKVADWSQHDSRVIAAGICGSYARGEGRPDSDIDFVILTRDPPSLLDDRDWILAFGADARVAAVVEDYNLVQCVRAFYDSTEAEFGITHEAWAALPIDRETASVINDGLPQTGRCLCRKRSCFFMIECVGSNLPPRPAVSLVAK